MLCRSASLFCFFFLWFFNFSQPNRHRHQHKHQHSPISMRLHQIRLWNLASNSVAVQFYISINIVRLSTTIIFNLQHWNQRATKFTDLCCWCSNKSTISNHKSHSISRCVYFVWVSVCAHQTRYWFLISQINLNVNPCHIVPKKVSGLSPDLCSIRMIYRLLWIFVCVRFRFG